MLVYSRKLPVQCNFMERWDTNLKKWNVNLVSMIFLECLPNSEFLIPKMFSLNAQVIHCRKHSMSSRVISGQKLPHRACFKFTFLKPGEKSLLRQFLQSIEPEKVVVQQTEESDGAGEDDDDFGELDDLDM